MMRWFDQQETNTFGWNENIPPTWETEAETTPSWGNWLGQGWQAAIQKLTAEVSHEAQQQIWLIGQAGAGKQALLHHLRGWPLGHTGRHYGAFALWDVPPLGQTAVPETLLSAQQAALLVYVISAQHGWDSQDKEWLAQLVTWGKPLLVVLNQPILPTREDRDQTAEAPEAPPPDLAAEIQEWVNTPCLTICATSGTGVHEQLLPALLDAAPQAALPLGRELARVRRTAARRLIHHNALVASMAEFQPSLPMFDMAMPAIMHAGLTMRIGVVYGCAPRYGLSREVAAAVGWGVACNWVGQQLSRQLPTGRRGASAIWLALTTHLLGEIAIRYYEAGWHKRHFMGKW